MAKGALNPQQLDFLERYMKPDSPTFGNAYDSAIAAGYSENYATNITKQAPWLVEIRGNDEVVTVSEILQGIKKETGGLIAKDRLKAWELLGKNKKLFTEKVEHTGKVEHEHSLKGMTDEQLEAIVDRYAQRRAKTSGSSSQGTEPTQS